MRMPMGMGMCVGEVRAVGSLVHRFIDAIVNGGELHPSFEEGLRVQILMDKIRRADESGRWLS